MIEVFKITRNIYDPRVSPYLFFSSRANTRGNNYKLLDHTFHYDLRKQFLLHTSIIYIFDSVCFYVSNGQPQFSTDLDQMWHAASLLPPNGDAWIILQRNRTMPEHRGQFLNASRSGSSYQPRLLSVY